MMHDVAVVVLGMFEYYNCLRLHRKFKICTKKDRLKCITINMFYLQHPVGKLTYFINYIKLSEIVYFFDIYAMANCFT